MPSSPLLVGDATTPPALIEQIHTLLAAELSPGKRRPWQRVHLNLQDDLVMKSIDPGTARYLGLMTQLDLLPDQFDAAGQPISNGCSSRASSPATSWIPLRVPAPDAFENRLLDRLMAQTPQLRRAADRAIRNGLVPRVFVAPALVAPLPDRPAAPTCRSARPPGFAPTKGQAPNSASSFSWTTHRWRR